MVPKRIFKRLSVVVLIFLGGFLSSVQADQALYTEEERNNIAVYDKVADGVVNITTTAVPMDFFLKVFPAKGSASGVIIDTKGRILTNHHVVDNAQKMEVTLADGSKWLARLIGSDPDSDLAVVQTDAPPEKLKVIRMGDSRRLRIGQKVLAIGNPFGLERTLSTGVISSIGRTILSEAGTLMEDIIQTDAAINPGNSGGPLLNSEGDMIGINTALLSPSGGSIGIGFAISINAVRRIIPELIVKGYVSYPWIGASVQFLDPDVAKLLKIKVERGAMIGEVVKDGPADEAGLKGGYKVALVGDSIMVVGGDVVVKIDQQDVKTNDELMRRLYEKKPGETVILQVFRDGKFEDVKLTLGERPRRK